MTLEELPMFIGREVARCRKAIAAGSPRDFWERRLNGAAALLEAGLDELYAAIDEVVGPSADDPGDCAASTEERVAEIRTVMQRAIELEMLRKQHAALLKACEGIERILTFVPATYNHVLPTLREAIEVARRNLLPEKGKPS